MIETSGIKLNMKKMTSCKTHLHT